MKQTLLILIVILFFAGGHYLYGQGANNFPKRRCSVKTLNFETGLLNNGTTDIITDKLGFTWVSTKTGLQRYNGYSLQTILPVAGKDTFQITSPVYFFELKNGSIWISFKGNVLEYNPATNSFSVAISLPYAGGAPFSVVPLKETEKGIWCMQEKKGIVIYSPKGKLLKQFSFFEPSLVDEILNSQEFLYLHKIASNEQFVFITRSGSVNSIVETYKHRGNILSINTEKSEFKKISLGDSNILSLACNQDKLFVLSGHKLSCINIADNRTVKEASINGIINENFTSGLLHAMNDNLLLLSINNHLFEFDTAGVYKAELTDLNRKPVAATGFIQQVYPDKFKRIWVLTNDDVKRIEDLEMPFMHFIYPDEKNNFIRSLYYDKEKNILLAGCFYSGIQLYDTMANPLWKTPLSTAEVKNILGIEKLTDNEYLVVTFGSGWWLLDITAKTIKPFNIPPVIESLLQTRVVNFCNNIQRISNSRLLVATGINVFQCELSGDHLVSAVPLLPGQANLTNNVNCFLYDSSGNLWAGTTTGILFHLDQNKTLQKIIVPGGYVARSIAEDVKHNIWVGTDKGLYVYTPAGKLLKKITRETGLRNDCIYALLPMDTGTTVFASSNLGISQVSLDGTIKNYSKEMGLQENEFNTDAACRTPGGKFYFGGINGITAFYPASLSQISDTPFLYITHLIVNDLVYNSSAGTWSGDTIRLHYSQDHLRFDLAAIGLLNSDEYVYQYRMSAFENSWQTSYNPTGINYTLQPGTYTLEVSCRPVLSSGSIFYKRFFIIISPPWWQTWWFRILAAALLCGAIVLLVQQYNRRKYLQKIRLFQTQQQIQEERERISRDLHDNLGAYVSAIASDVDNITSISVKEKAIFENLKDNAAEIMSNLRNTIWALNKENITVTGISDRFKNYIQKLQPAYPGRKIFVNESIGINHSLSPTLALAIFRIMQEAVHNALKHSGGDTIAVNIRSDDLLQVSITDNGKGFSFSEESNKGNGLQNMQLRAAEAKLIFAVENNNPSGTIVSITTNVP